ncbi:MAG TPA: hypothetical protein HPP97_07385 [Desulfuromonadales bacterium]|nr:hypothetical protein [Desulfuromonadales bacterium]
MKKNKYLLSDDPVCNRYLVRIEAFDKFLLDHVDLFDGLDLFEPYVTHINNIRAHLNDCVQFIADFENQDSENEEDESFAYDYAELEDELRDNSAENLEDLLNNLPDMTPGSFSKSTPKKYIALCSDIDEFFERYFEETIRKEGFKLYNAFLGAD